MAEIDNFWQSARPLSQRPAQPGNNTPAGGSVRPGGSLSPGGLTPNGGLRPSGALSPLSLNPQPRPLEQQVLLSSQKALEQMDKKLLELNNTVKSEGMSLQRFKDAMQLMEHTDRMAQQLIQHMNKSSPPEFQSLLFMLKARQMILMQMIKDQTVSQFGNQALLAKIQEKMSAPEMHMDLKALQLQLQLLIQEMAKPLSQALLNLPAWLAAVQSKIIFQLMKKQEGVSVAFRKRLDRLHAGRGLQGLLEMMEDWLEFLQEEARQMMEEHGGDPDRRV